MLRRLLQSMGMAREQRAHMTFGATSVGRSMVRTGLFLRKQLWIWPIIAIVVLSIVGFAVSRAIRETMEEGLRSELQTLLSVEASMLEDWLGIQESTAESLANRSVVREIASILSGDQGSGIREQESVGGDQETAGGDQGSVAAPLADTSEVHAGELHARLARDLGPGLFSHKFHGYVLADEELRIMSASESELTGKTIPEYEAWLTRAAEGQTTVSPPFPSVVLMKDDQGRMRTGAPTMFVAAPVRDQDLRIIGVLALRIRPEREFTRLLQLGRIGESGETFAFDSSGTLVSNSRFDESLILVGLLPDTPDAQSILSVTLRDPGGNLLRGHRPQVRRSELPLTKMSAAAVAGQAGVDIAGYRDYRGVPVVGAWTWLPRYSIGVATEIDYDEAFRPLRILRWAFYSLYGLLTAASVAIFVFTLAVARLQREARRAAVEAKQLGQYRLEQRLGAGAMGVVYKGHHAMLRRPTAIKLLSVDRVNEQSIQRFEREVQITCQLNSPHTIAIYDYGRTPEGVFYYAMEYLDGIDLQQLVERHGPQPEGRVIAILRQICQSLFEAHSMGLVHRDIKPANIMLNRRGGEPDFIKVLDFGLVKAIDEGRRGEESTGGLAGTPLYMSPEAIQSPDSVDACSDLYAVGAVGYFLLTGAPVFQSDSLGDLCRQHLHAAPDSPATRLGKPVAAPLEHALLACLEKSRARRPQTARELDTLLEQALAESTPWTQGDAEAWWSRRDRQAATTPGDLASSRSDDASPSTTSPGLEHTILVERK